MASIDVGSVATNRNSSVSAGTTYIDMANAANLDGVIDTIEIWANIAITGMRIGIFQRTTGNDFKCRSAVAIGAVTPAGSKQTFSGLNLVIKAGDFIGFYHTGGNMEYGTITICCD